MTIEDIEELQCIAPIVNMRSIAQHGILSHQRAERLRHQSVAMTSVQDRRTGVGVPLANGSSRPLHSYANLYICARNPMLYKRKGQHRDLCVIRVTKNILHKTGVVIADGNAASPLVRFAPAPKGLAMIDYDRVFAEYWTHDDPHEYYEHKRIKCAEVLVPDVVPPQYLVGAYVSCAASRRMLAQAVGGVLQPFTIDIDPDLFFC